MKKRYKLFGGYLPFFVLALIATCVMRTVALMNDYNKVTGYFTNKTLISVADYILVGASILLFTYIFTARKDMKLIPDFTSPATYAPTGITGAALLFVGIHFFAEAKKSSQVIKNLKYSGSLSAQSLIATERILLILAVTVGLLALLSAVHFVLCALIEKGTSFGRADFGIVMVAFLSVYAIYLYFDNDQPINSPAKILNQIAFLFAAVFFLYETRLSIGREKWRGYIAFGFISALISAYSSIPALIYFFTEDVAISGSIYEMILAAVIFIFVSARILLTGDLIEDKVSPYATVFAAASDARSIEIAFTEEKDIEETEIETVYENQFTIDDELSSNEENAEADENRITPEVTLAVGTDGEAAIEIESISIQTKISESEAVEDSKASPEAESQATEGDEALIASESRGTEDGKAPTVTEDNDEFAKAEEKNTEEESTEDDGASDNK